MADYEADGEQFGRPAAPAGEGAREPEDDQEELDNAPAADVRSPLPRGAPHRAPAPCARRTAPQAMDGDDIDGEELDDDAGEHPAQAGDAEGDANLGDAIRADENEELVEADEMTVKIKIQFNVPVRTPDVCARPPDTRANSTAGASQGTAHPPADGNFIPRENRNACLIDVRSQITSQLGVSGLNQPNGPPPLVRRPAPAAPAHAPPAAVLGHLEISPEFIPTIIGHIRAKGLTHEDAKKLNITFVNLRDTSGARTRGYFANRNDRNAPKPKLSLHITWTLDSQLNLDPAHPLYLADCTISTAGLPANLRPKVATLEQLLENVGRANSINEARRVECEALATQELPDATDRNLLAHALGHPYQFIVQANPMRIASGEEANVIVLVSPRAAKVFSFILRMLATRLPQAPYYGAPYLKDHPSFDHAAARIPAIPGDIALTNPTPLSGTPPSPPRPAALTPTPDFIEGYIEVGDYQKPTDESRRAYENLATVDLAPATKIALRAKSVVRAVVAHVGRPNAEARLIRNNTSARLRIYLNPKHTMKPASARPPTRRVPLFTTPQIGAAPGAPARPIEDYVRDAVQRGTTAVFTRPAPQGRGRTNAFPLDECAPTRVPLPGSDPLNSFPYVGEVKTDMQSGRKYLLVTGDITIGAAYPTPPAAGPSTPFGAGLQYAVRSTPQPTPPLAPPNTPAAVSGPQAVRWLATGASILRGWPHSATQLGPSRPRLPQLVVLAAALAIAVRSSVEWNLTQILLGLFTVACSRTRRVRGTWMGRRRSRGRWQARRRRAENQQKNAQLMTLLIVTGCLTSVDADRHRSWWTGKLANLPTRARRPRRRRDRAANHANNPRPHRSASPRAVLLRPLFVILLLAWLHAASADPGTTAGLAQATVFPSTLTGLVATFLGGYARIKIALRGEEAIDARQGRFRVMTRNICSFNEAKRRGLPLLAEAYGLDVIALQEINLPCGRDSAANQWERLLNGGGQSSAGPYFTSGPPTDKTGPNHKQGALLWISRRWLPYAKVTHRVPGRLVAVRLELPKFRQVRFVSVYTPPNKDENEQTKRDYEAIMRALTDLHNEADLGPHPQPMFIMGDVNSVACKAKDRISEGAWAVDAGPDQQGKDFWSHVTEWDWRDAYRLSQPDAKEVTFVKGSASELPEQITTGSRIDVVLLNAAAAAAPLQAGIEVERANEYMDSDHLPMIADVDLATKLRMMGPGKASYKDRPPRYNFKSLYGPEEEKKDRRAAYYDSLNEKIGPTLRMYDRGRPQTEAEWRTVLQDPRAQQRLLERADKAYLELAKKAGDAAEEAGCAETFSPRPADRPPTVERRHKMSLKLKKLTRRWDRIDPETRLRRLQEVSTSLPAGPLPQPAAPWLEWQYWREEARKAINRLKRDIPRIYKRMRDKKAKERRDKTRDYFTTDIGRYWQAVMGKSTGIVPFETIVEDVPGSKLPNVVVGPSAILPKLRNYFVSYWGRRATRISEGLQKPLWQRMYARQTHLKHDRIMDPECRAAYNEKRKTLSPTAPGDSNLQNSQVKSWPEDSAPNELLYRIISDCIRLRKTPASWHIATVVGISKLPEWDGKMKNIRPITLLEVGDKIMKAILVDRLQESLLSQNALQGQNSGFLRGKTTEDPLFILQGLLEDAHQYDRELYLILQDIRRAYDTVSWESMELAFRRLNIPEDYIELHRYTHEHNRTKIRTVHGDTAPFTREVGLAQGAVEAPIHWLIFYDALLCAQDYTAATEKGAEPYVLRRGLAKLTHTAFADDTHWIAATKKGIDRRAEVASEFCAMHDIEISAEKTRYVTRTPKKHPTHGPTMDAPYIGQEGKRIERAMSESDPLKILGVFLTVDLDKRPQIEYMKKKLRATAEILRSKVVYEEESVYLINTLVQGFLRYAVKMAKLSDADIAEMESTWRTVMKHHAGLSVSTPNALVHAPAPYGLFSLRTLQLEEQVTTLLAQLRDRDTLAGQVRLERLLALREAMGAQLNPLEEGELARYFQRDHLIAHTIHEAAKAGYTIETDLPDLVSRDPTDLIRTHLPSRDYARIAPHLNARGLQRVSQIRAPDGIHMLPWKTWEKAGSRAWKTPSWYEELQTHMCRDAPPGSPVLHDHLQGPAQPARYQLGHDIKPGAFVLVSNATPGNEELCTVLSVGRNDRGQAVARLAHYKPCGMSRGHDTTWEKCSGTCGWRPTSHEARIMKYDRTNCEYEERVNALFPIWGIRFVRQTDQQRDEEEPPRVRLPPESDELRAWRQSSVEGAASDPETDEAGAGTEAATTSDESRADDDAVETRGPPAPAAPPPQHRYPLRARKPAKRTPARPRREPAAPSPKPTPHLPEPPTPRDAAEPEGQDSDGNADTRSDASASSPPTLDSVDDAPWEAGAPDTLIWNLYHRFRAALDGCSLETLIADRPKRPEYRVDSDGSTYNFGTTKKARSAWAVFDPTRPHLQVDGRTRGQISNYKSELHGAIAATMTAPLDRYVRICCDNQAVVNNFAKRVRREGYRSARKRTRDSYEAEFRLWREILRARGNGHIARAGLVVEWVPGHDPNDKIHEEVDARAKEATNIKFVDADGNEKPAGAETLFVPEGTGFELTFLKRRVEIDPCKFIRMQQGVRHFIRWQWNRGTSAALRVAGTTPRYALDVLSVKYWHRKISGFRHNWRAYGVKALAGFLPLLPRRLRERPDLYTGKTGGECVRCIGREGAGQEDMRHLLLGCPRLRAAHASIQKEIDATFLKLYDDRVMAPATAEVKRAIRAERAAGAPEEEARSGRKRRRPLQPPKTVERATRDRDAAFNMRPVDNRALSARLRCYDMSEAHAHTPEAQNSYPGEWRDMKDGHRGWRNAHDMDQSMILRGLLPEDIEKVIRALGFADSDVIPVCRKLVETMLTAAHREIWKPRCAETAEYEATRWDIKPATKRSRAPKGARRGQGAAAGERSRRARPASDETADAEHPAPAAEDEEELPEPAPEQSIEHDEIGDSSASASATENSSPAPAPAAKRKRETEADRARRSEWTKLHVPAAQKRCAECTEHHPPTDYCEDGPWIEQTARTSFLMYLLYGDTDRLPAIT